MGQLIKYVFASRDVMLTS